jgi:ArsR family transcriptional regulator
MAAARVSQSSMSRHMSALKEAGLVSDRRDAQWVRYRWRPLADTAQEALVGAVLAADPGCRLSTQEIAA